MSNYPNDNTGIVDIDTVLAQNAWTIGPNVFEQHLAMDPWFNVLPKSSLPEGVGNAMSSLVYERSIPTTAKGGSTLGVNWQRLGTDALSANSLNTQTGGQVLAGAAQETIGAMSDGTGAGVNAMAYVKWTKKMREYYLDIGRIKSPYVDVNDLRNAANRAKQVSAIHAALGGATQWTVSRRNEQELERLSANLVPCLTASTPILTTVDADSDNTADDAFYGVNLTALDIAHSGASNADVTPTANISNKIMDRIRTRLKIVSPLSDAYALDNGAPAFACIISSEASYTLQTESGIRDDLRQASKVDDLIKPLGIDKVWRGFSHICIDTAPRYTISGGALTRVEPTDEAGNFNPAFESADYEAAYVFTKSVLEVQVPAPNVSAPGFVFDPVNYAGDFEWLNIQSEDKNPKRTIGFFMATLATASLPKNVERGYVILFKRTSTTPAA